MNAVESRPVSDDEIVALLPYVRVIAARYAGRMMPAEDAEQVAALALVRAGQKFDINRGTPFRHYARRVVMGALMHYMRDHGNLIRKPRSAKHSIMLDVRSEPGAGDNDLDMLASTDEDVADVVAWGELLGQLSSREQAVVRSIVFDRRTTIELAQMLGMSQPYVSVVYRRALKRLRAFIEAEGQSA